MVCDCVIEWIEETKREYGTTKVFPDINMSHNALRIFKIIQPRKDWRDEEKPKPRHSKVSRYIYRDYEFCPFCGKKLNDAISEESE